MKLVLNEYPVGRSQFSPDYRIHCSILFNFRDEILTLVTFYLICLKILNLFYFRRLFLTFNNVRPFLFHFFRFLDKLASFGEKSWSLSCRLRFQGFMNYQMLTYACWLSRTWIWMKRSVFVLLLSLHDLQLLRVLFASRYPTSEYSELNALSNF